MVYMSGYVKRFLEKWRKISKTKTVFSTLKGLPLKRRSEVAHDLRDFLGLDALGTHSNRRSFACVGESAGLDPSVIKLLLNHDGGDVTRASYLRMMDFNPLEYGANWEKVAKFINKCVVKSRTSQCFSVLTDEQKAYLVHNLGMDYQDIMIKGNIFQDTSLERELLTESITADLEGLSPAILQKLARQIRTSKSNIHIVA